MSTLLSHPAADLFPMLDDDHLLILADDIKANGQALPVIIWNGMVVDGRNRLRACEIAGIEPKTTEATFEDDAEAIAFIISTNINRRHLIESQRAMIAAELANMSVGRPTKDTAQGCAVSQPISQTAAAEMMNVSRRTVQDAKAIRDYAPDLAEKVKAGEMKVGAATKVVRERRAEEEARTAEPRPTEPVDDFAANNGPITKGDHRAQKAALDALEAAALEMETMLKKWWAAQAACLKTGVYWYSHPRRNQKSLAAAIYLLPYDFDRKSEFSTEDDPEHRIAATVAEWRTAWQAGLVGADALIDRNPKAPKNAP